MFLQGPIKSFFIRRCVGEKRVRVYSELFVEFDERLWYNIFSNAWMGALEVIINRNIGRDCFGVGQTASENKRMFSEMGVTDG
jgi:hypothetical protein